jgi:CzcA family heavy metal efflux pump
MIRSIIGSSLRFRLLVLAIAAGVIVLGVTQLRSTPVDVLPEFNPPFVEVQTEALGLSAEEVEQLVTVPTEADLLNGTEGVTVLRSESVEGLSSITLLFEPGTDLQNARQLVQEQLTQAHANPNVSSPPQMLQPYSSQSRVMMIGLSPDKLSPIQTSILARWVMRPRLLGVQGVANVSIFGLRDRQLQVLVDPQHLADKHVPLSQVVRTAGNAQLVSPLSFLEASTPGTGGFFETPNQRLHIRHILPTVTAKNLADVPLEGRGVGDKLRLGDVGRVVEGPPPLIGDAVVNGKTGLLIVVEKAPGANTLAVTDGVKQALDDLRPGLGGIKIDDSMFSPAAYIHEATDNLAVAVIAACLLLALALFAFLFDWRTALICLAAFAVSMAAAALVLTLTESTFNALVFAGLAAAACVVIDDAVMATQNIRRRLSRRTVGESAATVVQDAAAEIASPLGYATLVILLVALPVLFVPGISGTFFDPIARAYALTIVVSMFVMLTATPVLCAVLLSNRPAHHGDSPLARWAAPRYRTALSKVVSRPAAVIVALAIAVVAGLAVIPALDGPVIPSFKDRNLVVHIDGPPGTSRGEMSRVLQRASNDIRGVPGVSDVAGHIGRAITGDQVVDVNSSELWVKVKDGADYAATRTSIRNRLDKFAGLNRSVLTYEKQRIRDVGAIDDRQAEGSASRSSDLDVLMGTDRRPLVVRVYGENPAIMQRQAERMKQLLSGVDGVKDPQVESFATQPTVAIKVSLNSGFRYGIKPGDVRRKVATLLNGIQVGSIFQDEKVFDVVVRAEPSARSSLSDVRNMLIDIPGGGHVRLGEVADVRVRPTPAVIEREASQRRLDVSANVDGRSIGDVRKDVRNRIRDLRFPLEYHAEVVGAASGDEAHLSSVLGIIVAAAIGIFLLLQAALRSWRIAGLTFLLLPISLAGGLLASLIDGTSFSLGALIGLFAVLAIAARNVVVLIDHYQRLEQLEGRSRTSELVVEGAGDRLLATVTTACAVGLALLPFLFGGSSAGLEVVHPMALVIIGGLVTSTLLSLFAVPALYLRFGGAAQPAITAEDELMHRWAGVRPVEEDGRLQTTRLPATTTPIGGGESGLQHEGEE